MRGAPVKIFWLILVADLLTGHIGRYCSDSLYAAQQLEEQHPDGEPVEGKGCGVGRSGPPQCGREWG